MAVIVKRIELWLDTLDDLDYNICNSIFYDLERILSTMSNKLLEQLVKTGREHGAISGGPITKILIETAYKGYVDGSTDFWQYCKSFNTQEDGERVAKELNARIRKNGGTRDASFGFKITLDKNVLSRDTPYNDHLYEFVSDYKTADFQLVWDTINENNLPINETFWGRFQWRTSPWSEVKGDAGKTDTDKNGEAAFPTIRLPIEKFANEQAAKDAAGDSSSSLTNASSTSGQYSDMVYENYDSESSFELNFGTISEYYKIMKEKKVKPFDTAKDFSGPWTDPEIKQYLAKMYVCESPDIDLALAAIPF